MGHLVNDAAEGSDACNSRMKRKIMNGSSRLLLYASKDISPGNEILYDYNDDKEKLWWRERQVIKLNEGI